MSRKVRRARRARPHCKWKTCIPGRHDAPKLLFALIIATVHHVQMRANVNLDADAYTFASFYANARGIPLGAAISELLRKAEHAPEASSSLLTRTKSGFLVKKKTGPMITAKMAKELSEDDLG